MRGSSGSAIEPADDVLVQAEVLFGGLHRQATVELFADAEVELARVGPRRQGLGHRLAVVGQVGDDLGDEVA